MMMLGGASRHAGHKPPGKAERARAKAERAQKKAAEAQAIRAEAETIPEWPPDPSGGHEEQRKSAGS